MHQVTPRPVRSATSSTRSRFASEPMTNQDGDKDMMIHATGKAAVGFVDALKTQPLALALVVMNFALIAFVYYQSSQFNSQRADNVKLFTDVQREVQKLLAECIVPPPQQRQQRGLLNAEPSQSSVSHGE